MNRPYQVSDLPATTYDVVVVGGGATGMMAAATAAATGARTLLLEKNDRLGLKLSITGGGRCNVTNNKPTVRDLVSAYQQDGKFLFSVFTQFGVPEMVAWLQERGVELKEEAEGRLFPVTNSAETICTVLEAELNVTGVFVERSVIVQRLSLTQGRWEIASNKGIYTTSQVIIATGGTARPETGSTGDGFAWLAELGHTIVPNSASLVPIALQTSWTRALSGITLPDVKVSVWSDGSKHIVKRGRVLFTHEGLSGPLVLNLSQRIGDLLVYAPVTITLNLFPSHDAASLKEYFTQLLSSNKKLQNVLASQMPTQLAKGILTQLAINGETPCHSVRRTDRITLLAFLQALPLTVHRLLGPEKAVASAGGVALSEVNFRTMESTVLAGLYIVGDMLNINRPSGGYSLQLCWSTGYVAGQAAATKSTPSGN